MARRAAGLRRTILRRAVVARRTRETACFATRARAIVLRVDLVRRTVRRAGRFVMLRCMLRLAAVRRFAIGRRLATVRRFTDMVRLAATRRRAGFARRIVLRAVVFARTLRRARAGFFAVRDRDVRDFLNIMYLPTWLKVRRT
jgi:hypothetical protein